MTGPKMSGSTPRPWVKLWRGESAAFASLPVTTRGLAAELLKFADEHGRIVLPGLTSEAEMRPALWRLIGAHPRERQTLGRHLAALIAHGTIVVTEGAYSFPGWGPRQGVSNATPQLEHNQGATGAQLGRNWGATQNEAKFPKTGPGNPTRGDEEKEEEEELQRAGARDPRPLPPSALESEPFESTSDLLEAAGRFGTPSAAVASTLRRVWAECWGSRTAGQPPPRAALDAVSRQAGLVVAEAERVGASPHELAARSVTAFFAAKSAYRRPRVEWWTEDPLRWAGDEPDAAAPPEPAKPERFVALSIRRDGADAIEWQDRETGASWWQGERPPEGSVEAFLAYYRRKRQEAAGSAQGPKAAQGA